MRKNEKEVVERLYKQVIPYKAAHPMLVTVYDTLQLLVKEEPDKALEVVKISEEMEAAKQSKKAEGAEE